MSRRLRWSQAMESALYGAQGFYRRGEAATDHFRTSVHASTQFAEAIGRLAAEIDDQLSHPPIFDIVDIGSGGGELLCNLGRSIPPELRSRSRFVAVDVRPRPHSLPPDIEWVHQIPDECQGLLIANEWLDNIPVDVVRRTTNGGLAYVVVDAHDGRESLGPPVDVVDARWIQKWWPLPTTHTAGVAEVGTQRDRAWGEAISHLARGVAIAIDYTHSMTERRAGLFDLGTVCAFRNGHAVVPVPDGSCDITAHVALDACLFAGVVAGAQHSQLVDQRAALRALGVEGGRPPVPEAKRDPSRYLAALARASEAAELLDPHGLGAFGWLVQTKGVEMPRSLKTLNAVARR